MRNEQVRPCISIASVDLCLQLHTYRCVWIYHATTYKFAVCFGSRTYIWRTHFLSSHSPLRFRLTWTAYPTAENQWSKTRHRETRFYEMHEWKIQSFMKKNNKYNKQLMTILNKQLCYIKLKALAIVLIRRKITMVVICLKLSRLT